MQKELDIMLGRKQAFIDGTLPERQEQKTEPVQGSSPGMGAGLAAGIPLSLLMMYLGRKTKGMGAAGYNSLARRLFKAPKRIPGFSEYMAKAQVPMGVSGGFSNVAERSSALNRIFEEVNKAPELVNSGTLSMLNAEGHNIRALANNAPSKFDIGKLWEQHGPKTLPGMLATVGGVGLASNAGDIASNMFGGGSKRRGAPVIING